MIIKRAASSSVLACDTLSHNENRRDKERGTDIACLSRLSQKQTPRGRADQGCLKKESGI